MVNKVFKYGTGHEVPEGAIYLNTQVEEVEAKLCVYRLVWHYFLVEAKE